jgi:hypothetical protein
MRSRARLTPHGKVSSTETHHHAAHLQQMATIAAALLLYLNSGGPIRGQFDPSLSADDAKARAQEAWVFGLPVVLIDTLLAHRTNFRVGSSRRIPVNQFVHYRDFSDAASLSLNVLSVDTLYSVASINLAAEPSARQAAKALRCGESAGPPPAR